MAVNLEFKIKCNNHKKVKADLLRIGADFKGKFDQKDIYYKIDKGLLKLRVQGFNNELIKYERDESGKTRWSNYEILIINGNFVEDFFNALFKVETIIKKRRELWIYNNTRIHLDTVKNLGSFLELETLLIYSRKDARNRFAEIIELLHLDVKKQILASYRDLILKIK